MARVILVRHAQTAWNADDRVQGSTDVPLGTEGLAQAALLAEILRPTLVAPSVVTSPLSRAEATAQAIADACGVEPVSDAGLTQRAYGVWEGMAHTDIRERYPSEHALWARGAEPVIDGYETDADLAVRTLAALEKHARGDGDLVIVSHGSSLRVMIHAALGLPLGRGTVGKLGNCERSVLTRRTTGEWTLARHAVPLAGAPR